MSLDACDEPSPTSTNTRMPEVCSLPHHTSTDQQFTSHVPHTSPASTATSGQGRLPNHTMPYQMSECPSVASMHHHIPVLAQQAHNQPARSGRCADGDSELESSVTSGVAVDSPSTLTASSNRCLQQRQENAPAVMVGCQSGAVGGVRGALLSTGFVHTMGSSQPGHGLSIVSRHTVSVSAGSVQEAQV